MKRISYWLSLSLFVALALAGGPIRSAEAKWLKAESPLFVVYSDGNENELREFVGALEEYDGLLRLFSGTTAEPSPNKLTVYLVRGIAQLREVSPKARSTVAGFYHATSGGTIAVAMRKDIAGLSADLILQHEYAHHFMLNYHPVYYPTWYLEGFAEYFGATEFTDERMNVGAGSENRARALMSGAWAPMGIVLTATSSQTVDTFYAQSWLVVHYFMAAAERRAQLAVYLRELARGEPAEAALKTATGMDFRAFDTVMRAYRTKGELRGFAVKRQDKGKAEIHVARLSDAADDLLLLNARLWHMPAAKDAPRFAEQIRRTAAKYPGDVLALGAQAMAELDAREYDNAEATIGKLEAVAPTDVRVPYLRMTRYFSEGIRVADRRTELWASARKHAVAAFKLDPNHYPTLYHYAVMALDRPGPPDENTLNAIVKAHELAPAVTAIRVEAAIAMARAGWRDAASLMIQPAATAAHGRANAYVSKVLNQIAAGEELVQPLGFFLKPLEGVDSDETD